MKSSFRKILFTDTKPTSAAATASSKSYDFRDVANVEMISGLGSDSGRDSGSDSDSDSDSPDDDDDDDDDDS